jgi:hypothetical protein
MVDFVPEYKPEAERPTTKPPRTISTTSPPINAATLKPKKSEHNGAHLEGSPDIFKTETTPKTIGTDASNNGVKTISMCFY